MTRYALGVDLGTTYSAAAVARGSTVEICTLGTTAPQIPSVVVVRGDGTVLTGEAAERRAASEPVRTAREFKRRLGDPVPIIVGGTPYGAEALTALLLKDIVRQVSEREGGPPDVVVLTHPANYTDYKRGLLGEAARLSGLDAAQVVLVSEPEAAAIAYASAERVDPGAVVAVYDFGGGTFDAAVVRRVDGGFAILGTPEGMERLGGIDVDQAVLAHVDAALDGMVVAADPTAEGALGGLARLRDEARRGKEALSTDTDTDIHVALPGLQTEVRLTRDELEAMVRPRIAETVAALERSVASAGLAMADVSRILLVGGTSRMPLVGEEVRRATGRPVSSDAHPKFAIATGAALLGAAGLTDEPGVAAAPPPGPSLAAGGVATAGVVAALGAGAVARFGRAAGPAPASAGPAVPGQAAQGVPLTPAAPAGPVPGTGPAVPGQAAQGVPLTPAAPAGPVPGTGPVGVPLDVPVTPAAHAGPVPGTGPVSAPLDVPAPDVPPTPRRRPRRRGRALVAAGAAAGAAVVIGGAVVATSVGGDEAGAPPATTVATSELAVATSEPAVATSEPAVATSEPDVATTEAASTTAAEPSPSSAPAVPPRRGLPGTVSVVAGNGRDDVERRPGPAEATSLGSSAHFAVAPGGDVFVVNHENELLLVSGGQTSLLYTADTAVGESGFGGVAVGPDGDAYVTMGTGVKRIGRDGTDELVVDAAANGLRGGFGPVTFDGGGNLYFFDNGRFQVLRSPAGGGPLTVVAGTGSQARIGSPPGGDGGPATAASLTGASAMIVDGDGGLLVAESGRPVVRRVAPDGTISTVVGGGTEAVAAAGEYAADGTGATALAFTHISGLAVDAAARVYVTDDQDHVLARIGGDGFELLAADQGDGVPDAGVPAASFQLRAIGGVAIGDDGNLFFVQDDRILAIEDGAT